MAMMFLGDQEPQVTELARALCRHSQDLEADKCSELLNQFLNLRIANLAYKSADLDGEVVKQYDEKASGFRESMREAIQPIL